MRSLVFGGRCSAPESSASVPLAALTDAKRGWDADERGYTTKGHKKATKAGAARRVSWVPGFLMGRVAGVVRANPSNPRSSASQVRSSPSVRNLWSR